MWFKEMEASEATIKKHIINIDSSSNSTSHGHVLSTFGFSFNASSNSFSNEWIIDSIPSYQMDKDKAIFSSLSECNTKQAFVGDDRSLSLLGFEIVLLDDVNFKNV